MVRSGFTVAEVVDGLRGPTQFDVLPDGRLLVAQLNGSENESAGQIVVVDPQAAGTEPEVWFSDLDKPTGVAVVDGEVWVMERRRLLRGSIGGGELATVFDDLPYNGRSEGTLTATADGRMLYNTSGRKSGGVVQTGSGELLAVNPLTLEVETLARGFKHAYARVFASDGTLWQTEMTDGTFDGAAAPDGLMIVRAGDDFGWPRCVGDRRPVAEFGGTEMLCDVLPRPHALFAAGATPTSVAIAPWDDNVILVALWNEGRVVAVPADSTDQPVEPMFDLLTGIEHPQHLLAVGEVLYVGDFGGGRILQISQNG